MALGPWAAKPNLDASKFTVYQQGGKWYATRKEAAPAAPAPEAPQQPSAPAYTPPPPPTIDWNKIYSSPDAQAKGEVADLDRRYTTTFNNATQAYKNWVTQNYGAEGIGADGKFNPNAQGGMVARINRDTDLDVNARQNQAAARGMFRSGNRIVQEGQARSAGADKLTDLSNEHTNQAFTKDVAIGQAFDDKEIGANNAYRASAQRGIDDIWRKYGAGVYQ